MNTKGISFFTFHFSLFICLLALGSCNKTPVCDCFDSAGSESSQTRSVPYFEQIYVEDNVNVFISMGNQEQVVIEGGKNLIPNIGANVSGGVLTLKNNNICNWLRSYKKSGINVYITMPRVTYMTNAGYGTIQSIGSITTDSFQVQTVNSSGDIDLEVNNKYVNAHMFGTADLTLSGHTDVFLTNFFGGTGFMYCSGFESGYMFLSSSTIGDCYIEADNELDVQIYALGNVYYSGSPPVVRLNSAGSGQLIKD